MYAGRSRIERGGGEHTRENAGISSASGARNSAIESLRVPGEGLSARGKSGPKLRAKAVDDGQQADIPAPPQDVITDAMTQKDIQTHPDGKWGPLYEAGA